ncbi:MAG TPA: hypothetical protein VMP89_13440 [Solirubrobacteraceae bacterium]|nr:hypothetical protein [Solirubrobacteraceae bacterium]
MSSCEMRFPDYDARANRGLIRWELFLYPGVRDVLVTPREDTLRVLFRGPIDPTRWTATLTDAGFPAPVFGSAAQTMNLDRLEIS